MTTIPVPPAAQAPGRPAVGRTLSHAAIPASLHEALMAHLDRSGPAKELAQVAAVDKAATGLVAAIALGLAVTLLIDATGPPTAVRVVLATVLGTALTVYLAGALAGIEPLPAAVAGLVTTVGACGAHLLLGSALMAGRPAASLAVAGAPVATVGVVTLMAVNLLA